MKKRTWFVLAGAVLALGLLVPVATANPGPKPKLDKSQLKKSACDGSGKPIVDVEQKIVNDADSGTAGNAWAYDAYKRHITVWQVGQSTYCAVVTYDGKFLTVAGASPQAATTLGTVSDGVKGEFSGGYRSTDFTGSFTPGANPTHGNLGTFDYACNSTFVCPGYVDWTTYYFNSGAGASFDLAWWGWQYHAAKHGDWINSIDGNSGDITG